MWVQETELGDALDLPELRTFIKTAYDLVVAKLPKSRRPEMPGRVAARKRARPT